VEQIDVERFSSVSDAPASAAAVILRGHFSRKPHDKQDAYRTWHGAYCRSKRIAKLGLS